MFCTNLNELGILGLVFRALTKKNCRKKEILLFKVKTVCLQNISRQTTLAASNSKTSAPSTAQAKTTILIYQTELGLIKNQPKIIEKISYYKNLIIILLQIS